MVLNVADGETQVALEAHPVDATVRTARMAGKVVLVTGGGSGIGRATALLMAAEGAAVVIAGRRECEGRAAAAACEALGAPTLFVRADVSREEDMVGLLRAAVARFGCLDAVFNNAGAQERRARLELQDERAYQQVFDTNVRALFLGLKHQVPLLAAQGGGCIVINASVSGVRNPFPGLALYSASKAAAISLMRSAAMESAPLGVRINAVAPGRVLTDMIVATGLDLRATAESLPLRRMGRPEEVAEAVLWLCSPQSSYIVGHVLAADGGFLAS